MSQALEGVSGRWLASIEGPPHAEAMSDEPPRREDLYAELEKLPPNVVGEIVGGVLYASPRPALRHAWAAVILADELVGPFARGRRGPGGGIILPEPEVRLGQNVLVLVITALLFLRALLRSPLQACL